MPIQHSSDWKWKRMIRCCAIHSNRSYGHATVDFRSVCAFPSMCHAQRTPEMKPRVNYLTTMCAYGSEWCVYGALFFFFTFRLILHVRTCVWLCRLMVHTHIHTYFCSCVHILYSIECLFADTEIQMTKKKYKRNIREHTKSTHIFIFIQMICSVCFFVYTFVNRQFI